MPLVVEFTQMHCHSFFGSKYSAFNDRASHESLPRRYRGPPAPNHCAFCRPPRQLLASSRPVVLNHCRLIREYLIHRVEWLEWNARLPPSPETPRPVGDPPRHRPRCHSINRVHVDPVWADRRRSG
jgi:hypothetical protein